MQLHVLRLGVKNLLLHKLRSFLTVLGLLFGVASVISMLAVGEGASHEALEQIKAMGPTNVMVRTQRPPDTTDVSKVERKRAFAYGLKYVDAEKIRATLPKARHVVAVRETRSLVRHGACLMNSIVVGTQPEYESVMNLSVAEGRWLSAVDVGRVENCAVLGAQAATTLFPLGSPLGESVQCGTARFSIVGVLEPMGREASPGGMAMDQCLFVPITSSRSRFGDEIRRVTQGSEERTRIELNEIKVELETTEEVLPAARLLGSMLEIGQRLQDDVRIIVPLELLRQKEATARIFNLVLGSIAVISLLVGGIGIMNVMLATVTERTREIGIRRALGAKRRDIVRQFLVETAVLSGCGGLLGVACGLGIPRLITLFSSNLTIVQLHHVAVAFSISVAVGIAFGIYPAWRAARMDPVEALRHE